MASVIACASCPLWDQEHDLATKQVTIDYQRAEIRALSHDLQATRLKLAETITKLKRLEAEARKRKREAQAAKVASNQEVSLANVDWFGESR